MSNAIIRSAASKLPLTDKTLMMPGLEIRVMRDEMWTGLNG